MTEKGVEREMEKGDRGIGKEGDSEREIVLLETWIVGGRK